MIGALIRDRIFRTLLLSLIAIVAGCQTTPAERSMKVVQERAVSLAPLSKWSATQCRIEAHPTQPMLAVYRKMFPEDQITEVMVYNWRAQKFNCEIKDLQ